jgi:hypothetical protein
MSPGVFEGQHDPEGIAARWRTEDGTCVEQLFLRWENGGWVAEGNVAGPNVTYVLRLAPNFEVSQFLLFRDLEQPDLWLGHDGHGNWGEINGAHRRELFGCHDVDLACAAFPRSLPLRRLMSSVGEQIVLPVVVIDVDTLEVQAAMTTATRLDARRWHITNSVLGVDTTMNIDEHGLPLHQPGHHVRLA